MTQENENNHIKPDTPTKLKIGTTPQEKIDAIRDWSLQNYLSMKQTKVLDEAENYLYRNGVLSPYHDTHVKNLYKFIHSDPHIKPVEQGYSPLIPDSELIRRLEKKAEIEAVIAVIEASPDDPITNEEIEIELIQLIEQAFLEKEKLIAFCQKTNDKAKELEISESPTEYFYCKRTKYLINLLETRATNQ